MPIFQEDLERGDGSEDPPPSRPIPIDSPSQLLRRKCSEESIRTDLCEGIIPDSPKPTTPENDPELISDRAELIERLKRGESPTWVPNRRLESLFFIRSPPPQSNPESPSDTSPSLLPPANITPEKRDAARDDEARLSQGLEIERPRSALHSGDFREQQPPGEGRKPLEKRRTPASEQIRPDTLWTFATSPPRSFAPIRRDTAFEAPLIDRRSGPPSLCSSLSSSFAFQPPTSPLVQSESNDDLELHVDSIELSEGNGRYMARRHTTSYGFSTPIIPTQRSFHRRQGSFQAHQPQRAVTTAGGFQFGSPQTPALLRSRRPSFSSDVSPIQHASMVGSYEESILRGRMSTTPSKPLDFVAQIGVLGIGKCKSSLRCPPHVTLPFPAVFYSYANTSQEMTNPEDGPSPYVGQVDLENGLTNPDAEQRMKRKATSRRVDSKARGKEDLNMGEVMRDVVAEGSDADNRRVLRSKRRSGSPKCPPGGSYRIPEKGQIQIIIKNPNKTAVKLFLVPYDLSGMEPGTKTFIRQRSYSAGPIIENIPASGSDRPRLRYLVHIHICCPSRGRFYLYKSIRVVFANRVPDGKEKLRNEVTHPEPKYSPYKPTRVMNPPMSANGIGGAASALAMETAFRRRSSGFSLGNSNHFDKASRSLHNGFGIGRLSSSGAPVEPVPFRLPLGPAQKDDSSEASDATAKLMSPPSITAGPESSPSQFTQWKHPGSRIECYGKLNKGDAGYGGNPFYSPINGSPVAEGLLSKSLRSLEMQQQDMERSEKSLEDGM
ncbi:uncharacterized protein MKZ38_000169 [Zalerion maritima]|uniref:Atos-like conserved domain-containing protein n=1 Tax=Zalerion maritima TaxID=339359 RepID=A0AAD5S004_9PEZI|nr:uncharacterized protein MKZ38_000169 [Zalerion maritima]